MTREEAIKKLKTARFAFKPESETFASIEMAIRSLEAWEKVKADITETILYYKDWGQIEIKAQHKEEVLKEVLDCINRHLKGVTE